MARKRSSMRGDIDFFIIIAILLIVVVGASTAGGRLGGIGKSLNNALTSVFGDEPTPCPFLQKGALSGILGIGTTSKIVSVYNTSTDPGVACFVSQPADLRFYWNSTEQTIVFDLGEAPNFNECTGIRADQIINAATQELNSRSLVAAQVPNCGNYICCDKLSGPCICTQEDDGSETGKIAGRTDKFYCNLRYYMMTEALGFSSQAAKDAEFGSFAAKPMPSYICIIIFGLIPFLVMYYLIQDLLAFVFVRRTTKKMLAVAMASMAIVTGAFADVAYVLTKLTSISLSWSFLFLIFGTGLAAVVITNLMGLTSAASAMHRSLNEAHYGFMMLRGFGQQLEQASKDTK
jgi:hypothetical protein